MATESMTREESSQSCETTWWDAMGTAPSLRACEKDRGLRDKLVVG